MHEAPADSDQGRGVRIVEALSAHWGWHPEDGGKGILAILAKGQARDAGAASPRR